MNLDSRLRAILVCPQCHGELRDDDAACELVCDVCRLGYGVSEDDIPDMLIDDARSIPATA